MMGLPGLALRSFRNRKLTAILTVCSIALSVALLLGLERVRTGARESFRGTISGTDLVVGARSGPLQLVLYAVFHIGAATANVRYETFLRTRDRPDVAWAVPLALGDSHRGFRVVATSLDFFRHYRYRNHSTLSFNAGGAPAGVFDAAVGSEVAETLGYAAGRKIVISHGITAAGIMDHGDKPFVITGVLARTGTPVDRAVFITLEGMEAIHLDWEAGAPPLPGLRIAPEKIQAMKLRPKTITAFLVGTKERFQIIRLQREINTDPREPLLAVIPGVVLSDFWRTIGYAENALLLVSALVVLVGLLGMFMVLYTALDARRREIAVLRSIGLSPHQILILLVLEATALSTAGVLLGAGVTFTGLLALQPLIEKTAGLFIPVASPGFLEWMYILGTLALGPLTGVLPAWKAYRHSLADGLTIRT